MKKRTLCFALVFLAAFALWTLAVSRFDVRPIGPLDSAVGFAALNSIVHDLTGVKWTLYTITDWLGLVPICMVLCFGVLGLVQWIRRKNLLLVDRSILILGGFYLAVMAAFLLFEIFPVNYRPVLIDGVLEASYPSSTTMLVLCVMPTALMQVNARIQNGTLKRCIAIAIRLFTGFMVIGRLLSGVHWVTDIIGGALLSVGLVLMYDYFSS